MRQRLHAGLVFGQSEHESNHAQRPRKYVSVSLLPVPIHNRNHHEINCDDGNKPFKHTTARHDYTLPSLDRLRRGRVPNSPYPCNNCFTVPPVSPFGVWMREPFCIVKICSDRSLRRVQWRRSKSQKGVSKHSQNSGPAGTSFTMRKQKSGFPLPQTAKRRIKHSGDVQRQKKGRNVGRHHGLSANTDAPPESTASNRLPRAVR